MNRYDDLMAEINKLFDDAEDLAIINEEVHAIRKLASSIEIMESNQLLDSKGRLIHDYHYDTGGNTIYRGENPKEILKEKVEWFTKWMLGRKAVEIANSEV